MGIIIIMLISLALSFSVASIVNGIINKGLFLLKDEGNFFTSYTVFQLIIPTFLISFSIISIIFRYNELFPRIVQVFAILYATLILIWYNHVSLKKRKLKNIKSEIKRTLIVPWLEKNLINYASYSINLYYINGDIRGEVIINTEKEIPHEFTSELRSKLQERHLRLHFRKTANKNTYLA